MALHMKLKARDILIVNGVRMLLKHRTELAITSIADDIKVETFQDGKKVIKKFGRPRKIPLD